MTLRLIPYVVLDGNAAEAIALYERVFGAELAFRQTDGERISHATLRIGDSTLMVRDAAPDEPSRSGSRVAIAVATTDVEKARHMFAALQEDGHVDLPMKETAFSPAHGIVTDKFGVAFQITAQPAD